MRRGGTSVAVRTDMRQFPRPGRVLQRLGNVLPDASGEISVPRPRAATDRGLGVARLGVWTVSVELGVALDAAESS